MPLLSSRNGTENAPRCLMGENERLELTHLNSAKTEKYEKNSRS